MKPQVKTKKSIRKLNYPVERRKDVLYVSYRVVMTQSRPNFLGLKVQILDFG
jgi:hypothetical protein